MKNMLIHTHCKRCGSPLTMLKHSLFGAENIKAELGQICGSCLTPEEKDRILKETMDYALRTLTRKEIAPYREH